MNMGIGSNYPGEIFPFGPSYIKESEERRNHGDLYLLAARDIMRHEFPNSHKFPKEALVTILQSYDNTKGKAGTTTYTALMNQLEKDVRFERKFNRKYKWWTSESFDDWLDNVTEWEVIGALVDANVSMF